jgi:hypothetical protein
MKKVLLATFVSSMLFVSCSKSDDPDPVIPPAPEKYMTTTNGSTWSYAYVDNAQTSNNTNYTVTSSSSDTTSGGRTYHIYHDSDGSHEYYNITGSDYYTLQTFNLGIADTALSNLYLKDNAAAGTSWSQTYLIDASLPTPVEVTVTNKIQERNITKVVGTTTYDSVIHVVSTISVPAITSTPVNGTLTTDIHYYFAPKYGMIQNDTKIDVVAGVLGLDEHTNTQTKLTGTNF